MSAFADAAMIAVAGVVLAHGLWWLLLSLAAFPRPRPLVPAQMPPLRLAVIIPAHDESTMIAGCLESLAASPYEPRPLLLVVADNCTDGTAAVALARRATVVERHDSDRRGKSFALDFGLAYLRAMNPPPDAVIVVDADSAVSAEFFAAIAHRLGAGADIVQAHYAPAPGGTGLSALRRLAFLFAHWSRALGASRLGLGAALKGNGMAFRWALLCHGFGGTGLTEDAATTVHFARRGVPVAFEPHATVYGHMAASYAAARTQDSRWERGRLALAAGALRVAAVSAARGRFACAAGALEVADLPLSLILLLGAAGVFAAIFGFGATWLAWAAMASLVLAVTAGLAAARAPRRDLAALVFAPRFFVYKLRVYASLALRRAPGTWERTGRR